MQFIASVIKGSGRGKGIGAPTVNLNLTQVPKKLEHGIYACRIKNEKNNGGVLHYGPRPVFKDIASCEVHLLDTNLMETPKSLTVEIIQKLRDVRDFVIRDSMDMTNHCEWDLSTGSLILISIWDAS